VGAFKETGTEGFALTEKRNTFIESYFHWSTEFLSMAVTCATNATTASAASRRTFLPALD
jgi:hypothetical protein